MPLDTLQVISGEVNDISALRGLPLKSLYLHSDNIKDLSPLKGMPLKSLFLDNCKNATDLTPILELTTLQNLTIPAQAKNVEQLRTLPNLQRLGYTRTSSNLVPDCTCDEFWKAFDAKKK